MKQSKLLSILFVTILSGFFTNTYGQSLYQEVHFKSGYTQEAVASSIIGGDEAAIISNLSYPQLDLGIEVGTIRGLRFHRVDKYGGIRWNKQFYAAGKDLYGKRIITTSNGGLVFLANAEDPANNPANKEGLLMRLDGSGNKTWSTYVNPMYVQWQGSQLTSTFKEFVDIDENNAGDIVTVANTFYEGTVYNEIEGSQTVKKKLIYVSLETPYNGPHYYTSPRQKFLDIGTTGSREATAVSIKALESGGYILLAYGEELSINPENWTATDQAVGIVVKLDQNLNVVWSKAIGPGSQDFYPSDLHVDDNGIITVLGDVTEVIDRMKPTLIQLNQNGQLLWSRSYTWDVDGLYFCTHSLDRDNNGNIFLTGNYMADGYPSKLAPFMIKTNNQGQASQVAIYGLANRDEYTNDIEVFPNGNIFMVGQSYGTYNPYVFQVDYNTFTIQADNQGYTPCDYTTKELESSSNEPWYIDRPVTHPPYSIEFINDEPNVPSDLSLNKTRCDIIEIIPPIFWSNEENRNNLTELATTISPNPASYEVTIQVGNEFADGPIAAHLFNLSGQLVKTYQINSPRQTLPLQEEWQGLYILKMIQGSKMVQQKLVIE